MADQEYWIGSVGPLYYNDADQYPDAETIRGIRAPQIMIDDAPTTGGEVVRQTDQSSANSMLSSKIESSVSCADSRIDSGNSANSAIESRVDSSDVAWLSGDSQLESRVDSGDSRISFIESAILSESGARDNADSTLQSYVDALSLHDSTIDSKVASCDTGLSVVESRITSAHP